MNETEIIPQGTVSIIPPTDLPNLREALAEMDQEASVLPAIRMRAKEIEVKDANSYAEAGQMLQRVRELKKMPDFKLGTFLAKARRVVDWLRTEQNKHANAAEEIDAILKAKMSAYKMREIEAAAAEERRINEERRKVAEAKAEEDRKAREKEIKQAVKSGEVGKREAEQMRKQADAQAEAAKVNVAEVKVKPSVPSVSGVRLTTNWRFEIVNASLLPRRFLTPDLVAIGQEVRRIKDKAKAEAAIPGIRVRSE